MLLVNRRGEKEAGLAGEAGKAHRMGGGER